MDPYVSNSLPSNRSAPTGRTLWINASCLIGAFAVTCLALSFPAGLLMRSEGEMAVQGARNTLLLFLTPNIASFAATALVVRRHWQKLEAKECVWVGFVLALLPFIILPALAAFSMMLGSAITDQILILGWMTIPGIISAQMLRRAQFIATLRTE